MYVSTEASYLWLLRISVVLGCTFLGALIAFDIRLNTLGEPFGEQLMAMSIAISRIRYGITGMVGLEQVLETLKQIPNVSNLKLVSIESYEAYQHTIDQALQQALTLQSIDSTQLHAYLNDQGYLYFVTLAFVLFGIKIQSLSLLWATLLFGSVALFLVSYNKSATSLFLLWCLIVAIALVMAANPGAGNQLITVYNNRFMPILGLVPLLHIVLLKTSRASKPFDWVLIFLQVSIFVFVLLARAAAQWMLIALLLSVAHLAWGNWAKAKKLRSGSEGKSSSLPNVSAAVGAIAMALVLLVLAKTAMHSALNEKYTEELWNPAHVVWHSAFAGMTTDPVLMKKYVCSDQPLSDRLMGFEQIQCDKMPDRYPRLVYGVLNQPSDMHGFQAAVRYLRIHNSDEQIGSEVRRSDYFNLKWARYEEIMRTTYLGMLRQDPLDALYVFMLVKPLRYIKEVTMYPAYLKKGMLGSSNALAIASGLGFLFVLHYYLMRRYCNLSASGKLVIDPPGFWPAPLLTIYLSSLALPLVFYSQAHTVADSVVVLLALLLAAYVFIKAPSTSSFNGKVLAPE